MYLQGQLWGPHHLSFGVWGWGSQPAHQLVAYAYGSSGVCQQAPIGPERYDLPPAPFANANIGAMEFRWVHFLSDQSRDLQPPLGKMPMASHK